jgi:integrase
MAQITVRVSGLDRSDPSQRVGRTFADKNAAEARAFAKSVREPKTTWYVRVRLDSKTMNRRFASRNEAVAWSHEFEAEKGRGEAFDPRAGLVAFEAFARGWLSGDPSKRGSSKARDRAIVERHLIPALGTRSLKSIKQPDVQALVNEWSKASLPWTVARQFTTLQAILTAAVRAERIGRLHYSNWRRRVWVPACEALGLDDFHFHDLRHCAATVMVLSGVDVKTAQTRLGHSSPQVTLAIYARVTSEADRRAADLIGTHYFGGAKTARASRKTEAKISPRPK